MVLIQMGSSATIKKQAVWGIVFTSGLLPVLWISYQAWSFNLGLDPAKEITDFLGRWSLYLLWLGLAASPLRGLGLNILMRFRRMIGLYAAFYVGLHLLAFATFILGWRWDLLIEALTERTYIVLGASAFVMLIPLVVTSTKKWQRKLGRQWLKLHRLVYPISVLALLHVVWLVRDSYLDAVTYAVLLSCLLGYRLYLKYQ